MERGMSRWTPALLCVALVSCRSTTYDFLFDPSPAEIVVQPRADGPVRARGYVSVIDGRLAGGSGPPVLRLRLRMSNRGPEPLRLESESIALIGSDLAVFGSPRLDPPLEDVAPGGTRTWELLFPYPPGTDLSAPDLDGLSLELAFDWGTGRVEVTVPFARARPMYVDPYYGWHWSVGAGWYYD